MNELNFGDLVTIGTIIFVAGGLFWQSKSNSKKLDSLVEKDQEHDKQLHEHDKRLAVVENNLETQNGLLSKLSDKIEEIYKLLIKK